MKNKKLHNLKEQYLKTPIPEELDFVVKKSLNEMSVKKMKRNIFLKRTGVAVASFAALASAFAVTVNTNHAFAATMSKLPILGNIVRVITFREYTIEEGTFNANIKVPIIDGLESNELESILNEKYIAENKKLYEEFIAEMEELKVNGGGHLGVDSGYVVKTDTDRILSIGRYVVNTVGSSSTIYKYDTIDKIEGILITLPSLFKDNSYIDIISQYIKNQMIEKMQADEDIFYWIKAEGVEEYFEAFDKISVEQNFYINEDGKLIISFDKYEVAPGYMGVQEFLIPTEVISEILISNEYIK